MLTSLPMPSIEMTMLSPSHNENAAGVARDSIGQSSNYTRSQQCATREREGFLSREAPHHRVPGGGISGLRSVDIGAGSDAQSNDVVSCSVEPLSAER